MESVLNKLSNGFCMDCMAFARALFSFPSLGKKNQHRLELLQELGPETRRGGFAGSVTNSDYLLPFPGRHIP